MDIKPIETNYQGYRFRSRLEARWAVFFDTLSLKWEYEPEGYWIDGQGYLPDFYLPEFGFCEIKPNQEEINKRMELFIKFAFGVQRSLTFLVGIPDTCDYVMLVPTKIHVYEIKMSFEGPTSKGPISKHQIEVAVSAAKSARFGKNGKG